MLNRTSLALLFMLALPTSARGQALADDPGIAAARNHSTGTRPGVRTSEGRGSHVPVRQHEDGGHADRGRRADLQPAISGLRHPLRIQALGLPRPAAEFRRFARARGLLAGIDLAVFPGCTGNDLLVAVVVPGPVRRDLDRRRLGQHAPVRELLRMLAGMLQPNAGTAEIDGIDVCRQGAEARRRLVITLRES